MKTESLPVPFC